MRNMKTVQETKETLIQIIEAEIELRRELLDKMVGQLYPSIVTREMVELRDLKEKLK